MQSFSYAPLPVSRVILPVQSELLTTKHQQVSCIRLHDLQDKILTHPSKKYTRAMVLINTVNSYEIAENFSSSIKGIEIPLIVVKREDGDEILRCLERHDDGDIFASIVTEDAADSDEDDSVGADKEPSKSY